MVKKPNKTEKSGIVNVLIKLPAIILAVVIVVGASAMYSTLAHELMHTMEDRDPEFDVICWDLSENTVAFATSRDYYEKTYRENHHLQIYFIEGCLFMLFVIGGSAFSFYYIFKDLKKKRIGG